MIKKILSIDNNKLYDSCIKMESNILQKHGNKPLAIDVMHNGEVKIYCDSKVSNLFMYYNVFQYKSLELDQLKTEIINTFKETYNLSGTFYLQAWLNVFREGEFIDWHKHPGLGDKSWYGFYCVNGEGSSTETTSEVIPSINGQLTLEEVNEEVHRTTPWNQTEKHRITIGYNILPVNYPNTIPFEI